MFEHLTNRTQGCEPKSEYKPSPQQVEENAKCEEKMAKQAKELLRHLTEAAMIPLDIPFNPYETKTDVVLSFYALIGKAYVDTQVHDIRARELWDLLDSEYRYKVD